jgi:hypothetical protein
MGHDDWLHAGAAIRGRVQDAGSGGGASDIPICSIDPRTTPTNNVSIQHIGNRVRLGFTPINFDVNVFWCSDTSSFNFGRFSNLANLECVE